MCEKFNFDRPRLAEDELDSWQGYDKEGRLCMSKEKGLMKNNKMDLKKLAPTRQGHNGRNSLLLHAFSSAWPTIVLICCRLGETLLPRW